MKKIILITACFSAVITVAYTQTGIAYYDANSLASDIDPATNKLALIPDNKLKDWMSILNAYLPAADRNDNPLVLIKQFNNTNPLYIYLPTAREMMVAGFKAGNGGIPLNGSSAFYSIGNLNTTNFADGLAKLIVARAKEELYVSFFEKFQDFLNNKCPELKTLFPHTVALSNNFTSWQYANILNTLREGFDKDLHELLANIPLLDTLTPSSYSSATVSSRLTTLKKFFDSTNQGKIFLSAVSIGNGFVLGQKIPDVIDDIAQKYLSNITDADADNQQIIQSTIKLFNILSNSVKNNMAGKNYVSFADFTALMANNVTRNLFSGLVYQQIAINNIKISVLPKYTGK